MTSTSGKIQICQMEDYNTNIMVEYESHCPYERSNDGCVSKHGILSPAGKIFVQTLLIVGIHLCSVFFPRWGGYVCVNVEP